MFGSASLCAAQAAESITVRPEQVYKPYDCDLRPWNPEHFAECTAAKRIIMIGDSLMRQQWLSLACMLADVTVSQAY